MISFWGRDSALRCPRRVQRRNGTRQNVRKSPFRPLDADGDAAARRLYQIAPLIFLKNTVS
jgi:hypothetical protein